MIHPRRPRPLPLSNGVAAVLEAAISGGPMGGPDNPDNGHVFECECSGCSLFWATGRANRIYTEWCRQTVDPL